MYSRQIRFCNTNWNNTTATTTGVKQPPPSLNIQPTQVQPPHNQQFLDATKNSIPAPYNQQIYHDPPAFPLQTTPNYPLSQPDISDIMDPKVYDMFMGEDVTSQAELLALNLNNIVNMELVELGQHNVLPSSTIVDFQQRNYEKKFPTSATKHELRFNIPIDEFPLTGKYKTYLEYFYTELSLIILPLQSSQAFNPPRDILLSFARKEPYLFTAILACGAKVAYRKTKNPDDHNESCNLLAVCLSQLGENLQGDELTKSSNIETMLLTILLLTSENASSKAQKWRPHHRGAKDLLLKYASQGNQSVVMSLCKHWFASIEILACLSSPYGGNTQTDEELDILTNVERPEEIIALQQIQIIRPDGYNLLFAYYNDDVKILRTIIKLTRHTKEGIKVSVNEITELISLIHEGRKKQCFDREAILKPSNPYYEQYKYLLNDLNSSNTYYPNGIAAIMLKSGTPVLISWYDILHQLHLLAPLLMIFTHEGLFGLPKEHPSVQEVLHQILNFMPFLDSDNPPQTHILLLVQWIFIIVGKNCIYEEDKRKVMKFYDALKILGSGSADIISRQIQKLWISSSEMPTPSTFIDNNRQDSSGMNSTNDGVKLERIDSDVDCVAY